MIKKADIILSCFLIAVSLALIVSSFLLKSNGNKALITVDGDIFGEYYLEEDQVIEVKTDLGFNMVEFKDGKVSVKEADCPDKYCVSHVAVENVGETVVCLPHRLIVEINE